jgi:hypothetical protein
MKKNKTKQNAHTLEREREKKIGGTISRPCTERQHDNGTSILEFKQIPQ